MNVCHEYFERVQIYDSYASRKGKGTYAALERAKTYTRRYTWYLKLDVRKFFASIHHQVLKTQLRKLFKDQRLLEIFDKIIDSYQASSEHGLPIGNLSSQYFANHYLSGLDHYIKEVLRIKAYTRYMDDMVLWHQDKTVLIDACRVINAFVENTLMCELKPAVLARSKHGLPFLGYLIYPNYLRLSARSKRRFVKKMRNLMKKHQSGEWDEASCQRKALPLLAFTFHADSKYVRKRVIHHEGAIIKGR